MMQELHRLQTRVLYELAHHQARRFSELMAVTELTSDDFKFHLRKLIKLGLVIKDDDGAYQLTPVGKELANRFDYDQRVLKYQPKLTTAVYLRRTRPKTGASEYLFQQRLRQPFYGWWGVIGEPVLWGESFEVAAARGLKEHTGLVADRLILKGFYRQRDQADGTPTTLEDKLFVIMLAELDDLREPVNWQYAKNQWLSAAEAADQLHPIFDSCLTMLNLAKAPDLGYDEGIASYPIEHY